MNGRVYKICENDLWRCAERTGRFDGAPVDHADGYIHLSRDAQLRETARRHFAGRDGLLLVTLDAAALGADLRFEPARDGELFPHLYGPLCLSAVLSVDDLPLGPDGHHIFAANIP
jgi:uncharacterized protein (DUF952 family)